MPAPPSSAQTAAKNAASKGGAGNTASKGAGPKSSTAGRAPGASAAAAKANAAKASPASNAPAKSTTAGRVPGTSAAAAKSTALGRVAQAAKQNVRPSGTATQFGGQQFSPGQMYKNAARASSALNSVLNNTRLAGMNTRQTIDAVARNMGLKNPMGRAGMIGTFDHESAGLNPNALGDQGTAFGLGQWRGDRRTALGNYAGAMGQPINSPGLQTAFGITEMGRAYPKTLAGLQNANSIRQAVAAMNDYERPQGWTPGGDAYKVAGWNDRVRRSYNALDAFGAPAAPATQTAGTGPLQGRTWNTVLNSPYNTVFPERAPVTGTATSFPGRPRNDGARLHAGLDFAVAPGSVVTPTVPGKVVQVAYSPGAYGPTVQVMNTYGGIDRYALHQPQDIPVQVGQPVYAGTPLGVAGRLPGPADKRFSHLHYERITPQDNAHKTIVRGMQDGSLAEARGRVIGSTTTPASLGKANIQSSTPQWARAMGIEQGESFNRGVGLQAPGSAAPIGSQIASPALNAAAEAARVMRRDAALQTVASSLNQPQARVGAFQGPRLPGDPSMPRGIPTPQSTGMMPPNSFIGGDPRSGMAPGAFPAARPPSFVSGDPRAGMPPGAFPAAPRMQSPVMGDPRANMAPGAYPAAPPRPPTMGNDPRVSMPPGAYPPARMQSPVMGDPRANVPPGAFPAKPASVFADPRVGLPAGGMPRAKPISIVAGDPRANMRPGSYPAAPPAPRSLASEPYSAPPMGGALPSAIGDAFGVWGTTRNPPAAPHPGTPGSQTAEVQTDTGPGFLEGLAQKAKEKGGELLTAATEKQQELADNVEKYGPQVVADELQRMAGVFPRESYLATIASNRPAYFPPNGIGSAMGGGGGSGSGSSAATDYGAFITALQQAGATPEEIAYIQQFIDAQARA